jgi:hypothetical protein
MRSPKLDRQSIPPAQSNAPGHLPHAICFALWRGTSREGALVSGASASGAITGPPACDGNLAVNAMMYS